MKVYRYFISKDGKVWVLAREIALRDGEVYEPTSPLYDIRVWPHLRVEVEVN